jgi:hypothetical protein
MKSIAWLTLAMAAMVVSSSFAVEQAKLSGGNEEKLFQLLSGQKLTMLDGIKKVLGTSTEVPLAARFALDDKGELVLRILVCEKGFASDVDQAGLKLYTTHLDAAEWKPETRGVNPEHLMRASECWTLMAVSHDSLFDILARAEKDNPGIIYAIGPGIRDGRPEFILSVDSGGKKAEARYDLTEGMRMVPSMTAPKTETFGTPSK